jgi:hypothetical protein
MRFLLSAPFDEKCECLSIQWRGGQLYTSSSSQFIVREMLNFAWRAMTLQSPVSLYDLLEVEFDASAKNASDLCTSIGEVV